MTAYKREIQLSDLNDAILPNLKDFIEYLLDLSMLYSNDIVMPIAKVPSASLMDSSLFWPGRNGIKGTYQDEAILQASAESRLNKLLLLNKLGVVSRIDIDKSVSLERREAIVQLELDKLDVLHTEIIARIDASQTQKQVQIKQENEISYKDKKVMLGKKSFPVTGWEDAVSKVVFSDSDKNTFQLADIVEEYTGNMYSQSNSDGFEESLRQAIYRINDKVEKKFSKKEVLKFSKINRMITKNC